MSSKIEITESTVSQNKGRRSSRGNLGLKKKVVFEEVKNTNKDTSYEDDTEEDFECKKVVKKDEPIKEPILEEEDEECQYEGKKDKSQEGHEEEAEKEEAEEEEDEEGEEGEEREKEDEEEGEEEGEEQVEKQSEEKGEEEEKIVEKSKIEDNEKESALKKKAKKLILGVSEDSEDEIIDEEVKVKKTNKKKENKPKGKYESMTMKELQSLAKERNVERRSLLKKRDDIIEKLEELDRCPRDEEESKPKNKYQRMTIPEIKKIMAERGISGRSTLKKKEDMIAKLLECESSGELSETNAPEVEKKQKGKQRKIEEDPQDEEINRRVAELVNLVYKMKKHSKKQSDEFKEGFIDYIKDLTNQVEDYQESCNNSG